jgi:hypothetical protein
MIFADSKLKTNRAYQHIYDLESCFDKFLGTEYYPLVEQSDTDRGHKSLEFIKSRRIPNVIPLILGDAIHNARVALDLIISQVELTKTGIISRNSQFPFCETRDKLIATVKSGLIQQCSPTLADFIIDIVKSYRGGNDFLFALHDLDILDKHRLIIPTIAMTKGVAMIEDHSGTVAESVAFSAAMDFRGTVMETNIPNNRKIKDYRSDTIDIYFNEGLIVRGKPVTPTLHKFVEEVSGIIVSIEQLNI